MAIADGRQCAKRSFCGIREQKGCRQRSVSQLLLRVVQDDTTGELDRISDAIHERAGQQQSLATIDAAVELLSDLRALPVLDRALISPDRRYEASVRAKIDYGSVPFSLRLVMFWVNDWHRETDWYTWTLQP